MEFILTWSAIITGLISSLLWFRSALVKVTASNKPNRDGWIDAEITVDGINFIPTFQLQAKWNTAAASTAAITALLQAIATAVP